MNLSTLALRCCAHAIRHPIAHAVIAAGLGSAGTAAVVHRVDHPVVHAVECQSVTTHSEMGMPTGAFVSTSGPNEFVSANTGVSSDFPGGSSTTGPALFGSPSLDAIPVERVSAGPDAAPAQDVPEPSGIVVFVAGAIAAVTLWLAARVW
jgi:hypothetical protein